MTQLASRYLKDLIRYYLDEILNESNYENPVLQQLVIRPLESMLGSVAGESRNFIVKRLLEIARGNFEKKTLRFADRLYEIILYPKLLFFSTNALLKVAIQLKKRPSLDEISSIPSHLRIWRNEVELSFRNAAIRGIGRLNLGHEELVPTLLATLENIKLRASSAETLGKISPGEIHIAKAIIDTIQNHRNEHGWDRSVVTMVRALGILAQRHSNIVDMLLEMVNNPEPSNPPGDIHYILTLALHKAAEINPNAMIFIVEAWRRFPNDNVIPDKGVLVEFTEDIREGLKDCSKFTPIESISPEVLEYLLCKNRHLDKAPYTYNLPGVLAGLIGDFPLVQCKILGPNGAFLYKSVDVAEEIFTNFLYRFPIDIYSDVAQTLLFRWALNNPNFAVRLFRTIQAVDSWIIARLLEENLLSSTDELNDQSHRTIQALIESLRSPNKNIQEFAFNNLMNLAWSSSEDSWIASLPQLIEFRKWSLLTSVSNVILSGWQAYDLNIKSHSPAR